LDKGERLRNLCTFLSGTLTFRPTRCRAKLVVMFCEAGHAFYASTIVKFDQLAVLIVLPIFRQLSMAPALEHSRVVVARTRVHQPAAFRWPAALHSHRLVHRDGFKDADLDQALD